MRNETMQKILLAIAYLATHGKKINKTRVANYTKLSWATVHRYFEEILPAHFLIDDIKNFERRYKDD